MYAPVKVIGQLRCQRQAAEAGPSADRCGSHDPERRPDPATPGIITEINEAVGRTLTGSLPFGGPVRQDMLRARAAVVQNKSVKRVSSGRGFSVSAEGRALNNAAEGQMVQVRVRRARRSGIARPGAIVEVSY